MIVCLVMGLVKAAHSAEVDRHKNPVTATLNQQRD